MGDLYCGDNLNILRQRVADQSVDLVYLDPPFKTNRSDNTHLVRQRNSTAPERIKVFDDTWRWNEASAREYQQVLLDLPEKTAKAVEALRVLAGETGLLVYLVMMAPRLVEFHRVLKPGGALYLHCDHAASHYLKVLLDAVFAPENFRNEIVWTMQGIGRKRRIRKFATDTQSILYYTKTGEHVFNEQSWKERVPKDFKAGRFVLSRHFRRDQTGRVYWTSPRGDYTDESVRRLKAEGRIHVTAAGKVRVKFFAEEDEGAIYVPRAVTNSWTDIPDTLRMGAERLGFPTQKPEALLERILRASSNEGDLVLDPFCGSGTTLVVAERLRRRWIGIDASELAVKMARRRLEVRSSKLQFDSFISLLP